MNANSLRLLNPEQPVQPRARHLPLGRYLVEAEVITGEQLVKALHLQLRLGAPLGEILIAEGWASCADIRAALALQHGIRQADLDLQPVDTSLCRARPSRFWLHHRVVPWMRFGNTVLVATARPDRFETVRETLGDSFANVVPVLAGESQIDRAIATAFRPELAIAAGNRVADEMSCRSWRVGSRAAVLACVCAIFAALVLAPQVTLTILSLTAIATLVLFAGLRLAALTAWLGLRPPVAASHPSSGTGLPGKLPKVSVLVPLFRERAITGALVERLARLSYPKVLLDVILVLEEHDGVTRKALEDADLPSWMRVIEVPAHDGLTTKPRAMNFALDFCRGDFVGVWDAEDAPAPDQIERIVERFGTVPDDVVCLQGILDYYNPRTNWRARCFTIEYASWFRVILPGIARLGLVVPLGGTTLFFRRDILENLGGWDAHNVTEDADLGMRLCRAGYRTELIDTVTHEEANCRAWPWVKQRSRWLKGFMVTYIVHMRSPRRLLRDLGTWRFLSLQAFFLGTLGQFLLAPVLWSFWLIVLGFSHPIQSVLPGPAIHALTALFVSVELLALLIGMIAVSTPQRRFLLRWVPTMILYFPLGAVAAYKALYELAIRPFYWDKTEHGLSGHSPPP